MRWHTRRYLRDERNHPRRKTHFRRGHPLLEIGSFVGAIAVATFARSAFAQNPPSPVTVATVEERTIAAGQRFVGTVQPVRTATVGSAVDGRVLEYPINEGDAVKKGQPLCQLRTETIEIELAGAQAELELRRQELAELENGTRPEEIDQAQARTRSAEALMRYRKARLERTQTLFNRGNVTEEELEESVSAASQSEEDYLSAKAALALARAGPRREQIEQARARMLTQQEVVRRIEDMLAKYTIVAPFDGYVVAEHTEVGEWVGQGDPVAEIVELDYADVAVTVLENYIPYVRVGTEARVDIGALANEPFTGSVALIVPQADVRSRSFPVKVRLQNRSDEGQPLLKAGMFAYVTLPVGKPERALLVPKDALVLGGPSPLVYVVEFSGEESRQGTVRPVPVELGIASEGMIQIKGDVQAGQMVVVQGNERLRPGQEVIAQGDLASRRVSE